MFGIGASSKSLHSGFKLYITHVQIQFFFKHFTLSILFYIYQSGESGVVGVYVSIIGSFKITLVQYKGLIGTGGVIGFLRNTILI